MNIGGHEPLLMTDCFLCGTIQQIHQRLLPRGVYLENVDQGKDRAPGSIVIFTETSPFDHILPTKDLRSGPNLLGLHCVTVRRVAKNRLRIGPIEAIDCTPVLEIKPVLPGLEDF